MTAAKIIFAVVLAVPFSPILLLIAYGAKKYGERRKHYRSVAVRVCECGRTSCETWESYLSHMKRCSGGMRDVVNG